MIEESNTGLWETHAGWWQTEFANGTDPEYTEQILPLIVEQLTESRIDRGRGPVLDIGTGEGQVARHLIDRGHHVIGIDPVEAQIIEAARRGGGAGYVRAGADRLPFPDRSFAAAVACLVFEHIDAVDEAIAETARVLESGGVFVLLLNHPLLQTPGSGWIDDQIIDPPEQYWRIGPYLIESETVEEVQKEVFIRFIHRPLSRYLNTLARHGLYLQHMVEPAPPPGFLTQAPEYELAGTVPRLLALRCRNR